MKRYIHSIFLVIILLFTELACFNPDKTGLSQNEARNRPIENSGEFINVDDLMNNPEVYTGLVQVEGIVSIVNPEKQMFGLIDLREFIECGVTTCASLTLPVQWSGAMPTSGETVHVSGEVKNSNGQFVFHAQDLK